MVLLRRSVLFSRSSDPLSNPTPSVPRKNMKFTGLILICASSCLALILPAIGVVQFPKSQHSAYGMMATDLSRSVPIMTQNIPGPAQYNMPANPQRDVLPYSMLPNTTSIPTSPFPSSALPPPSITQTELPPGIVAAPTGNKSAMGIWLLLGPVCLLGLALWTLSPNPSGSKPKFTRRTLDHVG